MPQNNNWNVRQYFDDKTRKKIHESITDETLAIAVEKAYEDSLHAVERREVEIQKLYQDAALLLEQTSKVTDMSKEVLLSISRMIAVSRSDLDWYDIVEILYAFHSIVAQKEKISEGTQ